MPQFAAITRFRYSDTYRSVYDIYWSQSEGVARRPGARKFRVTMTRILIADDADLVRTTLRHVLELAEENWRVCGEASNGQEAIEKAVELKPDLVLLDMAMPQLDGISAARMIRAKLPELAILIYTFMSFPFIEEMAKQAGAQGVVQKGNLGALIAEIRRVLQPKKDAGAEVARTETGAAAIPADVIMTVLSEDAASSDSKDTPNGAADRSSTSGEDENPPEAI